MHVLTQAQRSALSGEATDLIIRADAAAEAINNILDQWGGMSTRSAAVAARDLRALADLIDGSDTASATDVPPIRIG